MGISLKDRQVILKNSQAEKFGNSRVKVRIRVTFKAACQKADVLYILPINLTNNIIIRKYKTALRNRIEWKILWKLFFSKDFLYILFIANC